MSDTTAHHDLTDDEVPDLCCTYCGEPGARLSTGEHATREECGARLWSSCPDRAKCRRPDDGSGAARGLALAVICSIVLVTGFAMGFMVGAQ